MHCILAGTSTSYSEFQLRSNLHVAYASVRNRVWMYACTMRTREAGGCQACQQNQLENRCTRDSVRKRTQHGDSNATEIRCTLAEKVGQGEVGEFLAPI